MADEPAFSYSEASRVLPLIISIMHDVIESHTELEGFLDILEAKGELSSACVVADAAVNGAVDKLQKYIEEVEKYGGLVRDSKIGLVDFRGHIDGEPVWFCWSLDEPTILYYHKYNSQCERRKLIIDAPR